MALAYAATALEMLAGRFWLYLHVKGLSFAFLLPSMELNKFLCPRIRFCLSESDENNSGFVRGVAFSTALIPLKLHLSLQLGSSDITIYSSH